MGVKGLVIIKFFWRRTSSLAVGEVVLYTAEIMTLGMILTSTQVREELEKIFDYQNMEAKAWREKG